MPKDTSKCSAKATRKLLIVGLLFPALFLLLELVSQGGYPFNSPYFLILIKKSPILLSAWTMLAMLRAYSGYLICFLFFCFVTSRLFRGRFRSLLMATSSFLMCYYYVVANAFLQIPSTKAHLTFGPHWFLRVAIVGAVVCFLLIFVGSQGKKLLLPVIRLPLILVLIFANFTFLYLSAPAQWLRTLKSKTMAKTASAQLTPSVIFLSFDAVPGDFFYQSNGKNPIMPFWQKTRHLSLHYSNAYSVTNSTYTSLMSVFSGKAPWQTGVETLYPHHRIGNLKLETLLPHILSEHGYHTVYMTDCATTAAMKLEYGFSEIYQVDAGAFRSTEAILVSTHPFLNLFRNIPGIELFPEFNSYSSALYQPESFFSRLEKKIHELEEQSTPYFIAAHSCLTHRDVAEHSLPDSSPLLAHLPKEESPEKRSLFASLRWADANFASFHGQINRLGRKPWLFLFSDHGVRIDLEKRQEKGKLKYFSHALGLPINRFQYHIPLEIYAPDHRTGENANLVSLLDLYPTVLALAGLVAATPTEGVNLLDSKLHSDRGIVLSSAISSSHPKDYQKTVLPLIKAGQFNRDGDFFFSKDTEKTLIHSKAIGYLKLPYRFILEANGNRSLYHELNDPYALKNIISLESQKGEALFHELCGHYLNPPCSVPTSSKIARQ